MQGCRSPIHNSTHLVLVKLYYWSDEGVKGAIVNRGLQLRLQSLQFILIITSKLNQNN